MTSKQIHNTILGFSGVRLAFGHRPYPRQLCRCVIGYSSFLEGPLVDLGADLGFEPIRNRPNLGRLDLLECSNSNLAAHQRAARDPVGPNRP